MQIVIDATDSVLGRLCSFAAKQSLLGKEVIIVNCAKAVITGKKRTTIKEYQHKRALGGASLRGPFFPKHPYRVVKRTVRGMVPYKKGRGLEAYKRVMCYDDVPTEFANAKMVKVQKKIMTSKINLEELGREI
jgi:large subunit ribosomal protein L13